MRIESARSIALLELEGGARGGAAHLLHDLVLVRLGELLDHRVTSHVREENVVLAVLWVLELLLQQPNILVCRADKVDGLQMGHLVRAAILDRVDEENLMLQDLCLSVNHRDDAGGLSVHDENLHARDITRHPADVVADGVDHIDPSASTRIGGGGHLRGALLAQAARSRDVAIILF